MADRSSVKNAKPFIVVGIDGSPGSRRALAWALRQAHGREVRTVLVWSDPYAVIGPSSMFGLPAKDKARLRRQMATTVRLARADVGEMAPGDEPSRIVQKLAGGHPAEVLATESIGADMLVVGTRGIGGFKHLLLGSVSQRCAQISEAPVVIVPSPEDDGDQLTA